MGWGKGSGAMIKGVRVPERAYHIILWVVSIVFAGFIVGLGNLIIGDLPQVEERVLPESSIESPDARNIRLELAAIAARHGQIDDKLEIERLQLDQARRASQTGTETFQAWIQARTATTNPQGIATVTTWMDETTATKAVTNNATNRKAPRLISSSYTIRIASEPSNAASKTSPLKPITRCARAKSTCDNHSCGTNCSPYMV